MHKYVARGSLDADVSSYLSKYLHANAPVSKVGDEYLSPTVTSRTIQSEFLLYPNHQRTHRVS